MSLWDAVIRPPMPAAPPPTGPLRVGRLSIDPLTFDGAIDAISGLVQKKAGGSVFTPNVDHVVIAENNDRFVKAYEGASLSLVDGTPILWASHLLGHPLPEKVSGSDLVVPLAERARDRGWRVFLLGGEPGVAAEAAEQLQSRFPGIQVVGTECPQIGMSSTPEEEALLERVRRAAPDLLLVALGAPKQELFIDRVKDAIGPCVAVAIGGTLDFIAGRVSRAPRLVSKLGLEWLYRLCQEPRRLWRRYLFQDPAFLWILLRSYSEARKLRREQERSQTTGKASAWAEGISFLKHLSPIVRSQCNLMADIVILVNGLWAATWLPGRPWPTVEGYWLTASLIGFWVVASAVIKYYDPWELKPPAEETALITVLGMGIASVLAVADVAAPAGIRLPSPGHFLIAFWPTALAARFLVFRPLAAFGRDEVNGEVLVVGTSALGRITAEDLLKAPKRREIRGFLALEGETGSARLPAPVLGLSDTLEQILRTHPIDEVYLTASAQKHGAQIQSAIETCERFGTPFALPACSFRLERARPADKKACADGYLHYLHVDSKPYQNAFKRLCDIAISSVALLLLSPLMVGVALAIRLTSRGPIFFRQVRVGLHGRPFNILKFRSMVDGADRAQKDLLALNEQGGPVFKIRNDPRVTAVGRFIRRHSIDELPQILNVLRGDMSLVGPRPPVPGEVAQYEPWQWRRLSMRPGLTCFWQVSGRNGVPFDQWMYLDMRYIDHWTLWGDVQLILRTVPVVLTGRGAS